MRERQRKSHLHIPPTHIRVPIYCTSTIPSHTPTQSHTPIRSFCLSPSVGCATAFSRLSLTLCLFVFRLPISRLSLVSLLSPLVSLTNPHPNHFPRSAHCTIVASVHTSPAVTVPLQGSRFCRKLLQLDQIRLWYFC